MSGVAAKVSTSRVSSRWLKRWNPLNMEYIDTSLLLLILFLLVFLYRKITRVHLASYQLLSRTRDINAESKNLYGQIQAYIDLKELLGLGHPLPRLRNWAASPDFLIEIARHSLKERPHCTVECSSGASTIVLARCAQISGTGHVFSLENDAHFAEITRANLRECNLAEWATVTVAPLVPIETEFALEWYSGAGYKDLMDIDMLVIDGPPATKNEHARYPAMPELIERLNDNAAIYLDDTNRAGEQKIIATWLKDDRLTMRRSIDLEKGGVELRFHRGTAG